MLQTFDSQFTAERTQSNGWLWEHEHPFLQKISKKLDHMLQLKIRNEEEYIVASEAFQVGVYSPGGLYMPHYDAFSPLDVSENSRLNMLNED